jgi:outer membrane biosynthesis protein TonB
MAVVPSGGAVKVMKNPVAVSAPSVLQAALIWQGRILGYRLVGKREKLTVGSARNVSFITPPLPGAVKKGFAVLTPSRHRGRHQLNVIAGLRGDAVLGGETRNVADLIAEGRPVELEPGDRARLLFDDAVGLRLEIRYVEPAPAVPRPGFADTEPFLARIVALTSATLFLVVAAALVFAPDEAPRQLAIAPERVAKILPPAPPPPPPPPEKKEAEKAEEKSKEESGQMKKAKEEKGRLGKQDALQKDTIVPKGEKDILRDKVMTKGILGIMGRERNASSGLSKLFANDNLELEQAVAGMKGATLAVGRGAGGLATAGAGIGGGGTGDGHIYGAGDINTGGRSSRGRGKGPTLAARGEREVKLDIGAGAVDEGGGLSKEQVYKVVKAHQNAIKFCYEKELQRKPTLAGTVKVFWTITPEGSVEKSKISSSSVGDEAVEGCLQRQVKQWAFPRSDGKTEVNFPFVFKGGT